MPVSQKTKEFILLPAGKHILRLKDVVETENRFKKEEPRWRWEFVTKQKNENGEPFQISHYTNSRYGNEKASLTLFLDRILPHADDNEKENLDTDELIGNYYKAVIKHGTKEDGSPKAFIDYIEPHKGKPDPEPEPEDDGDDPFADE